MKPDPPWTLFAETKLFSCAWSETVKMWLWLSGELPEEEQQYCKQHRQNCTHCQEALAAAQTVQDHYASLPLNKVRDEVIHNLIRRLRPQKKLVWRKAVIIRWFSLILIRRYLRPRLIVAGAVLATFLIVFSYHLAYRQDASLTWEAASLLGIRIFACPGGSFIRTGATAAASWAGDPDRARVWRCHCSRKDPCPRSQARPSN